MEDTMLYSLRDRVAPSLNKVVAGWGTVPGGEDTRREGAQDLQQGGADHHYHQRHLPPPAARMTWGRSLIA